MFGWHFSLGVVAALLFGCTPQKTEDKLIGQWIGDAPIPPALKNDPSLRGLVDMMRDKTQLELRDDHTYTLRCWATKTGSWKLESRRIRFEETNSKSDMTALILGLDFGTSGPSGSRSYSAVLSSDDRRITMVMGRVGDVEFHR